MSEEDIFHEALAKSAPQERAAYLEEACAGDPELRASVEALLEAAAEGSDFLHPALPRLAETCDSRPLTEGPGARIGPYKLLQQIGEGGMGVVYMAEQEQPVRRKVALKIIKPGMDSQQVLARFEAERQALALMDHQNIARVLDAGTTDSGRPYFVMELVKGVPIIQFCDDNHLTLRERLELFVPVCQAIQHAHQKGIIHRDIKPSNVLVTLYDGKPVPKVIDFGVAKAIEQRLTERTLFTQLGQVVGTLEYMSPEQAELNALDIDTRSDIYSLGVLLYELLTGSTPLQKQKLRSAGFAEMLRLIREEEPPKPSTRLSASGDRMASISAQRKTEPAKLAKLAKLVRGELDWIVMKALEKDRGRRYATANGFARDIQRYLADEPVEACPPRTSYKLRKFARKNRKALATAAAFVLLLAAAAVVSTGQAIRATRAETKAREAQALAEQRFDLAKQAVDQYLNEVTETPELKNANFELLRKKLLETALPFYQKLAEQAPDDPEREAARGRAYERLGKIRGDLGDSAAALGDFQAMHAIFARLAEAFPGEPDYRRDLSRSLHGMVGTGRLANAEATLRAALAIVQQLVNDFPSSADYRSDLAGNHHSLGGLLRELAKWAEAETEFRAALQDYQRLADEHANVPNYRYGRAKVRLILGYLVDEQGRLAEAEAEYRAALKDLQRLADEHPDIVGYRDDLSIGHFHRGNLLKDLGKFAEAEAELRVALKGRQRLANEHPNVPAHRSWLANCRYCLGNVLGWQGKFAEAEAELRAALQGHARLDGEPNMANDHRNLGHWLGQQGKRAEAEAECRAALAIDQELADPSLPQGRCSLARSHLALGYWLGQQGKRAEAETELRAALAIIQRVVDEHPNRPDYRIILGRNHSNLGLLLVDLCKPAEAEAELRAALKEFQYLAAEYRSYPIHHRELAASHNRLGALLHASLSRWAEAEAEFRAALKDFQRLADKHPNVPDYRRDLATSHCGLGNALLRKGDREGAIRAYQAAIQSNPQYAEAHCNLGHALVRQDRFAEALRAYQRGHELGTQTPRWPYPSAQWVRNAEQFVALKDKLPKLLQGEAEPTDAAEQLVLAHWCQEHKRLYATATRSYAQAFAAQPKRADNLDTQDRYSAACAAALAACGWGEDAARLDDRERLRLRQQALAWLRADLALRAKQLVGSRPEDRVAAQDALQHWLRDADLAGVRGEALAKLPEAERRAWHQLWADVAATLARAQATPEKKADMK